MKQIIIAVVAIVAIIGGAVLLSGGDDTVSGQQSNNYYGQENGVVTVTEFADFQCPGCASFYPIVKQVKEQFKDKVRFEYKHFPLVSIHPNAISAHRAAQAAANQGKFWEMHDLLFEQQNVWNTLTNPADTFRGYAEQIGLDMTQYDSEVNSSEILSIINADTSAGKQLGVNGTPTFYIDGVLIQNPTTTINSVELFSAKIQEAIDAKEGTQSSEGDSTEETEDEAVRPSEDSSTPEEPTTETTTTE